MLFLFLLVLFKTIYSCDVFNGKSTLTVGVTSNESIYAGNWPIAVYDADDPSNDETMFDIDTEDPMYIDAFLLVDHASIQHVLNQAEAHVKRPSFKSTSVVCVKSQRNEPSEIIFRELWVKTMRFVVIETANGTNYIYNPFKHRIISVASLNYWDLLKEFHKIWRDLSGIEVKVSAIEESLSYNSKEPGLGFGLDSSFLFEFSHHYNFTPIIVEGKSYPLSNLQVWSHQVEFGVNSRFISLYDQRYTMSRIIYGDDICFVVQLNRAPSEWNVFKSFLGNNVWLCFLATIVLVNSMLSVFSRSRSWSDWLKVTIKAVIAIPITLKLTESKERLILGSCFLFSLIFTAYVQAMLYEAIQSSPPVEAPPEENIYKFVHVMRDRPFKGSYTVMRRKEYFLSASSGLLNSNNYELTCPGYTRNMAYLMKYGSSLEPIMNKFVATSFEAGLPNAWYIQTFAKRKKLIHSNDPFNVLNLADFEAAFFVLLFGLSLASIVFFAELIGGKFRIVKSQNLNKTNLEAKKLNRPNSV